MCAYVCTHVFACVYNAYLSVSYFHQMISGALLPLQNLHTKKLLTVFSSFPAKLVLTRALIVNILTRNTYSLKQDAEKGNERLRKLLMVEFQTSASHLGKYYNIVPPKGIYLIRLSLQGWG